MFKPIIYLCCLSLLSAYHTLDIDAVEFYEQLKAAESEVFRWLRDEYHCFLNNRNDSHRLKRANEVQTAAESGEDWYRKFQCRTSNKSCTVEDEQVEQVSRGEKPVKNGEKSNAKGVNEKRIEEDVMRQQQQQVLSDYHRFHYQNTHSENSPNEAAINRLLNAKTSLAAKQNEIHEIELKHLTTASSSLLEDDKNLLNENQLLDIAEQQPPPPPMINEHSSNNNFHSSSTSNLDTSLARNVGDDDGGSAFGRMKRSSGRLQKRQQQRDKPSDDQFNTRRNTLFDELDDGGGVQQRSDSQAWRQHDFNEPRNRVKRRDAINQINRNNGLSSKSIDYETDGNHLMNHLINPDVDADTMDNNLLNDKQHVNTSTAITATQEEMNNGNENFSNDKSDCKQTANNDEKIEKMPASAANNARVMRKRDADRSPVIKGRFKMSDIISGELPNEVVKATHNLVNSNELLRQHVKPHLPEPQFSILRDPSVLKSNKANNLVSYIDELINEQVRMRSCIELTPELQKFYNQMMQDVKQRDNESDRDKKSVDDSFLMTKRKFKRNTNNHHNHHHSKLELEQKCAKVRSFHANCLKIEGCTELKPSLIQYFKGHEEICEVLENSHAKQQQQQQHKRSLDGASVTRQFAKLYNYRNYFLDSNFDEN